MKTAWDMFGWEVPVMWVGVMIVAVALAMGIQYFVNADVALIIGTPIGFIGGILGVTLGMIWRERHKGR